MLSVLSKSAAAFPRHHGSSDCYAAPAAPVQSTRALARFVAPTAPFFLYLAIAIAAYLELVELTKYLFYRSAADSGRLRASR